MRTLENFCGHSLRIGTPVVLFFGILVVSNCATATLVQCNFSGTIISTSHTEWGNTIPNSTPVSGTFYFDTNSTASGSGNVYQQSIPGGFTATIGAIAQRG